MRKARFSLIAAFVVFLLALVPSAVAQVTSGTITGVVTDTSGAVVAGANVTITSMQTGAARTSTTSAEGAFSFPELSPGIYNITVTKQGFKKVEQKGVEAHVADLTNVTIKMPVGGMVETVEVQASAVQVETQTGVVGNLVTGQEVRELPMNGRNFVQLTTLMPGAAVAENFDAKNKGLLAGVDISFSGAPANANQWRVDGANNNDIGSQRTILVYPSIDAIEEFKILRNSYGPEFGGAGGAQINIVTRGGGNDFHGSAYYFGRNDALNAKNYLLGPSDPKQLLRRNDYGYTVGGPIKKDKVFFFWSQEWNKEKRARVRAFQVPTAAQMTGDYTDMRACPVVGTDGLGNPLQQGMPIDPGTGARFGASGKFGTPGAVAPTDIIPSSRLSPAGLAYLSQVPLPNRSNPCGVNWVQGVLIPVDWREENVRGDINITKSTVLTLRYTQDAWKNTLHGDEEGGLWGDQFFPALSDAWDQPGKVAIAKLTTTIGSTATNDFTFSWSANRINLTLAGDTPGLNDSIKGTFQTVFPQDGKLHGAGTAEPICWCGGPANLMGHFGPWNNGQDLFTWKDDYSKVMGKHILRAGIYYSKNKKDEETGADNGGLWGPTGTGYGTGNNWNGTTGQQYSDFMLKGIHWGYGENVKNGRALARWSDLEFYVGDSWKARSRLTVEYGFRWSFDPPVYDANNNYSSFRPDLFTGSGAVCDGILLPSGSTNTCAGATVGTNRSLAPSNYHLIAPRLGIAWDVFGTGRFAVRAGVGQFFSRDPVGILVRVESNNAPEAIAPGGERDLDGNLTPYKAATPTDPGNPTGVLLDWVNGGGPKQGIEYNSHVANSWQWNLTTETELWRNAKLEVGWVALRGIHLNSSESLNQVAPADRVAYINAGFTGGNQNSFKPFGSLPAMILWNHRGDSIYHSLQTTFQTKLSRNSQFQTSYTWSKNLSDTTLAYVDTNTGLADTYNPRVGRGNSDFDRRHIFNASLIYNLPTFEHQNSLVKQAFGNWEMSTIVNLFSGAGLKIGGGLNGTCYMDAVANTKGIDNNCDATINPATIDPVNNPKGSPFGKYALFNGSPWGIGNSAVTSAAPNRDFSQPCHVSGGDRTQWLNQKAYTWEGFKTGGYPNAGPGSCSGPGVADIDFSILKNWNLPLHGAKMFGEKSRLQFRLEFFNLFNHPMFRNTDINFNMNGGIIQNGVYSCAATGVAGASDCNLGNSGFGVAKTPSNIGNREIQYALKLIF